MKTKRKIGVVTALLIGFAITTHAQDPAQPTSPVNNAPRNNREFKLSVGPEFGLPISDFSNSYSWIFGGSVQADIPVANNLYVVANVGYNDAFVKSNSGDEFQGRNLQLIPAKAGLKYFVFSDLIYIQATAGVGILGNHTDVGASKTSSFIYSPQVGVQIRLAPGNYIDAGFYFQQYTSNFWNSGNSGTLNTLGLRLAYSFGL
jgi:hypothetical protein